MIWCIVGAEIHRALQQPSILADFFISSSDKNRADLKLVNLILLTNWFLRNNVDDRKYVYEYLYSM